MPSNWATWRHKTHIQIAWHHRPGFEGPQRYFKVSVGAGRVWQLYCPKNNKMGNKECCCLLAITINWVQSALSETKQSSWQHRETIDLFVFDWTDLERAATGSGLRICYPWQYLGYSTFHQVQREALKITDKVPRVRHNIWEF